MAKSLPKKILKELDLAPYKSIWLRAKSANRSEREIARDSIQAMVLVVERLCDVIYERSLPPPPPPPPPPIVAVPKPEVYELPYGIARRRWRRREQVPKTMEEFAAFFRYRGITVLEVTAGSVNVPKEQASRINRILNS